MLIVDGCMMSDKGSFAWDGMCIEDLLFLAFDVFEKDSATGRVDDFSFADDGAKWFVSIGSDDA